MATSVTPNNQSVTDAPLSVTVSTNDQSSAVDAVASLTASLAAMNTTADNSTCTTVEQSNKPSTDVNPVRKRSVRASAPVAEVVPRYAMPTAASIRREAATLRQIESRIDGEEDSESTPKKNVKRISRSSSSWLRERTVPKSPKFSAMHRRRSSFQLSQHTKENDKNGLNYHHHQLKDHDKIKKKKNKKSPKALKKLPTVPKSPNLRSRGPAKSSQDDSISRIPSPTSFKPTPLPAFLIERDVLPDIKLNAKTVAAMERIKNPVPHQPTFHGGHSNTNGLPPRSPSPPPGPTVPEPFELRSVTQHESRMAHIEEERSRQEKEEQAKRIFQANILNEAILDGPTFVPTRSDVPLTRPIDLLPYAEERSLRTKAYEERQRLRIEQQERDAEEAQRKREEEKEERLKEEYELKKFKAKPAPKSTYVPHMEPVVPLPQPGSYSSAHQSHTTSSHSSAHYHLQSPVPSPNDRKKKPPRKLSSSSTTTTTSSRRRTASGGGRTASTKNVSTNHDESQLCESVTTGSDENDKNSKNTRDSSDLTRNTNVKVSDTSEPQTPASVVSAQGKSGEEHNGSTSFTSETSPAQDNLVSRDSNGSGSGLLQKMRSSLSPLLGGMAGSQ